MHWPACPRSKNVDQMLWRVLPSMLDKQGMYLRYAGVEPSLWAADAPHSAFSKLLLCGRRLNLHLILLQCAAGWFPTQTINSPANVMYARIF